MIHTNGGIPLIKILKLLALTLTLLLLVMVFYGICKGIFYNSNFWLLYFLVVMADLFCIAILKKFNSSGKC
jgi:hypothetical protein